MKGALVQQPIGTITLPLKCGSIARMKHKGYQNQIKWIFALENVYKKKLAYIKFTVCSSNELQTWI